MFDQELDEDILVVEILGLEGGRYAVCPM